MEGDSLVATRLSGRTAQLVVSSSHETPVVACAGRPVQRAERRVAESCRGPGGSGHREAPSQLHPGSSPAQTRHDVSPQHGSAAPWSPQRPAPPGSSKRRKFLLANSKHAFLQTTVMQTLF